jgi:hypothetical protein
LIISGHKKDTSAPIVPADPVKKMFFPSATTNDRTRCCSTDKVNFAEMLMFEFFAFELPAEALLELVSEATGGGRMAFFVSLEIS